MNPKKSVEVVSPLSGRPLQIPASHILATRLQRAARAEADEESSRALAEHFERESKAKPRLDAGYYTLIGPKGHRTFRVLPLQPKEGNEFSTKHAYRLVLSLMVGSDNERSYRRLGFIDESAVRCWKAIRGTELERLAGIFYQFVVRGSLPPGYRVEQSLRCRRCGRLLTTPRSLELGIGPECEKL